MQVEGAAGQSRIAVRVQGCAPAAQNIAPGTVSASTAWSGGSRFEVLGRLDDDADESEDFSLPGESESSESGSEEMREW